MIRATVPFKSNKELLDSTFNLENNVSKRTGMISQSRFDFMIKCRGM